MNAFGGNENQFKLSRLCSKWPQVDRGAVRVDRFCKFCFVFCFFVFFEIAALMLHVDE